jgi:hypothetical protein
MRCGLLQALNTRYATFYFSDYLVILDILTYGDREIYSFLYPRTPGKSPGEDFSEMANILGENWWDEQRRTKRRHDAMVRVLNGAIRNRVPTQAVKPYIVQMPAVKESSLTYLNIEKSALHSSELRKIITDAYRRQAKTHHPDLGGDAEMFLKIANAYEELISWADNPSFIRRRGFPDKWFYVGEQDRWHQPTPLPQKG